MIDCVRAGRATTTRICSHTYYGSMCARAAGHTRRMPPRTAPYLVPIVLGVPEVVLESCRHLGDSRPPRRIPKASLLRTVCYQ